MKYCPTCGATMEESYNVCTSCGTKLQAHNVMQPPKQPISIGGWIGRNLIPCIPLVGPLVYLIMLFIWSGDTTKEDTFRNWAKAQLIVMLVVLILTVLFAVLFGSAIVSLASQY